MGKRQGIVATALAVAASTVYAGSVVAADLKDVREQLSAQHSGFHQEAEQRHEQFHRGTFTDAKHGAFHRHFDAGHEALHQRLGSERLGTTVATRQPQITAIGTQAGERVRVDRGQLTSLHELRAVGQQGQIRQEALTPQVIDRGQLRTEGVQRSQLRSQIGGGVQRVEEVRQQFRSGDTVDHLR